MSLADEPRAAEQARRNAERLRRWRLRWFRATSRWPDENARALQVLLHVPWPLSGPWPSAADVVRAARRRRGLEVAA